MSIKEFYLAIGMQDKYNEITANDRKEKISRYNKGEKNSRVSTITREFSRYRSYVYKENMIRNEIMRLTAQRMQMEKVMSENGITISPLKKGVYKRGRSEIINLWLELSQVCLKKRELENKCKSIEDTFVRKVCEQRYFSPSQERLDSWAMTAKKLEIPMTACQLQNYVTDELERELA